MLPQFLVIFERAIARKKILIPYLVLCLTGCGSDFEPKLKGWTAHTDTFKPIIYLSLDGRAKKLELSGNDSVGYHNPQWLRNQDILLLEQSIKKNDCYEYQIVAMDTSGVMVDTIFTAPPRTALHFKLAPNDSLIVLQTCTWDCDSRSYGLNYKYTFYNRFSKKFLFDSIKVNNALNIILNETIWSPDSKRIIVEEWIDRERVAFTYDIVTKDTSFIDTGANFIWSPSEKDIVAYVKDHSLYTKNISTGEKQLIFKGRKKKSVSNFRWSPTGDFLMINLAGYFLVESYVTWNPTLIYLSLPDKKQSKTFYYNERIDTWK